MITKSFFLIAFAAASCAPFACYAQPAASSTVEGRVQLIEAYLSNAGCAAAGCEPLAAELAATDASTTAPSTPELQAAPVPVQLHAIVPGGDVQTNQVNPATPPQVALAPKPANVNSGGGNGLLQHLSTLFVLDALFQDSSNGLLTPGPVTLGNIIILYQLFYAPHIF